MLPVELSNCLSMYVSIILFCLMHLSMRACMHACTHIYMHTTWSTTNEFCSLSILIIIISFKSIALAWKKSSVQMDLGRGWHVCNAGLQKCKYDCYWSLCTFERVYGKLGERDTMTENEMPQYNSWKNGHWDFGGRNVRDLQIFCCALVGNSKLAVLMKSKSLILFPDLC